MMPGASLNMLATILQVNYCETCCRKLWITGHWTQYEDQACMNIARSLQGRWCSGPETPVGEVRRAHGRDPLLGIPSLTRWRSVERGALSDRRLRSRIALSVGSSRCGDRTAGERNRTVAPCCDSYHDYLRSAHWSIAASASDLR